jgi:hypothetical protein
MNSTVVMWALSILLEKLMKSFVCEGQWLNHRLLQFKLRLEGTEEEGNKLVTFVEVQSDKQPVLKNFPCR